MQLELNLFEKNMNLNWNRFNSVFIIEVTRGGNIFTSTAVSIGDKQLLTAAHSVDGAEMVRVLYGHEYSQDLPDNQALQWSIHPSYNPGNSFYENDLAVIFLEDNLPHFTNKESIGSNFKITEESIFERIGFGARNGKNIMTWTNPKFMSVTFNSKNILLNDTLSVIGDSGGPVYIVRDGKHELIGIHSTLEGSDKTYIVKLSSYIDWIYGVELSQKLI